MIQNQAEINKLVAEAIKAIQNSACLIRGSSCYCDMESVIKRLDARLSTPEPIEPQEEKPIVWNKEKARSALIACGTYHADAFDINEIIHVIESALKEGK